MSRREVVAWEGRWSLPVAVATFAAVALFVASYFVVSSLSGGGEAESLRSVHTHSSNITASASLQAVAFLLLVAPLVYLFQAASARSPRMRRQYLPLVVLAPLALCAGAFLNGVAANESASDFVGGRSAPTLSRGDAGKECRSEQRDDAAAFHAEFGKGSSALADCTAEKLEDNSAQNAINDASMQQVSGVFQLVGALALGFTLGYCCFHAMRVGLLSRFWGSLGIALGVAAVLGLFPFALIWFFYFALLVLGRVPGGRPPAWGSGEAVPWPTPGEKAAAELGGPPDEEAGSG